MTVTARRWDKRLKRALGYYDLRARAWRSGFHRFHRQSDVFLVGHPKSGNTWVAYMIAVLLAADEAGDVTLANLRRYVPYVHGRDHKILRYPRLPDPRVFRQEYPLYPELYRRVIYLIRDPRSVLVSLWHMFLVMGDAPDTTLPDFVDQYMAHRGCFEWWNRDLERWDGQVTRWLDRAETDPGVLVVRYEDLVDDRLREMRRIVDMLGPGANEARLGRAVEWGAFRAMQRLEDLHGAEAYRGRRTNGQRFVRRGTVDGWRTEMPATLAREIENAFGTVMRRVGYASDGGSGGVVGRLLCADRES